MPVPTDITAGTISISGSTVTGVGTSFVASDIRQGDLFIWIEGGAGQWSPIVQTVTSNTTLTLVEPWTGPTISGARYRLRYQWDSSRVSAQSRQLIEMLDNGNVLALAGLTGPGVPVFDGPHSMTIRPETDFINGVAYNVQVDTLADRAAYDGQAAGFSVLVSDVGDGRSAVYSKASNTNGDWTDPAYITGPIGGTPDIASGTTTTLPPGSDATFDVVPDGSGGYLLNTGIPAGRGFTNRGAYDSGEDYVVDDVVTFAGSTFIAIQAVPSGNPPSSAMPPVDNAYWAVIAARGANGAGTVSSVAAGSGIAVDPSDPTAPSVSLANVPTATIKGRVTAGAGAPTDLTGTQVNTILPVFGTAKGLVPAATAGDAERVLRGDGTWVTPSTGSPADRVINGDGNINQASITSSTDGQYGVDRHYSLTQTGAVSWSTLSDVANGVPSMMRLTQPNATAQRMGIVTAIESKNCRDLRGKLTCLAGKIRASSAATVRYAVLEWTGAADSISSDIVADWTSTSFTAGGFFIGTSVIVRATGSLALAANTLTDFSLNSGPMGSSFNNLYLFVWTDAPAAQSFNLDLCWGYAQGSSLAYPIEFKSANQQQDDCERYLRQVTDVAVGLTYNSTLTYVITFHFRVRMRTTPTAVNGSFNAGSGANGTFNMTGASPDFFRFSNSGTGWNTGTNVTITVTMRAEL